MIKKNSICVDAACSGNPWEMEYQGIDMVTWEKVIYGGVYPMWTNNIWEYLAIVKALKYIWDNKLDRVIYSDSSTAMTWVKNKKPKTTLEHNEQTADLLQRLQNATIWLHTHNYTTKILKRDTENRWEIPADFWRK